MRITRCKDQKNATLEDFYGEAAASLEPVTRKSGEAMLDWIARLRALPNEKNVYGLTSLYRLCLLSEDTYTSPWFVIISASDERNYYVEYLMPEHQSPWPNAYVRGEARSADEAVQMVVTAMEKCGGWS
ncbi:MAG TPA: hypothetical protein VFZ59_22005 [Verrucomicrobiae bacterium]|nr:hypothetical protein [Verrucomicrobiae bacterium]